MSVNRAEFSVAVKSTFDAAGIDQAKSSFTAMKAQIKSMEEDLANAQRTGISVPQESLDQLEKLKKSVASYGQTLEKTGVSHKELHEGFRLAGQAAGDALGPIGELGHFLSNPWMLAAEGAVLVIKTLNDKLQELQDQAKKNIIAAKEMADALRESLTAAAQSAAAELNNYNIRLQHARDSLDLLAEAQRNQISLAKDQETALNDQAAAQERLTAARIHEREVLGQITPGQASFQTAHAQRMERAQREQAADAEGQAELDSKLGQISAEQAVVDAAQRRETPERAAVTSKTEQLDYATRLQAAAKTALDEAKEKAAQAQAEDEHPTLSNMWGAALQAYGNPADAARHIHEQNEDAQEALQKAQEAFDAKDEIVKRYTRELAALEATLKADEDLVVARQQVIEALKREVEELDAHQGRQRAARAAADAAADETARVTRRTDLEQRQQQGAITPDESIELGAMRETGRQAGEDLRRTMAEAAEINRRFEHESLQERSAADTARMSTLITALNGYAQSESAAIRAMAEAFLVRIHEIAPVPVPATEAPPPGGAGDGSTPGATGGTTSPTAPPASDPAHPWSSPGLSASTGALVAQLQTRLATVLAENNNHRQQVVDHADLLEQVMSALELIAQHPAIRGAAEMRHRLLDIEHQLGYGTANTRS